MNPIFERTAVTSLLRSLGRLSRLGKPSMGIGLLATALGVCLVLLGVWEPLERGIYTSLFRVRNRWLPTSWDDRIVVIAIDDHSLATYGQYPWTRDLYTALLDKLMTVQPAAIGFDILMSEPTAADGPLAEAIKFSGNVVLAAGGDGRGNALQVTPTLAEPVQGFLSIGHVKHTADADGVSRQAFLYERHDEAVAPSFAIALLDVYRNSLANLITTQEVELPDLNPRFLSAPAHFDQARPLWINWPGPSRTLAPGIANRSGSGVKTLSFADVLAEDGDETALTALQNQIVLVGYTAVGIVGDGENSFRTPFEQTIPTAGVYLHAAILDNLLQDRFLARLPLSGALLLVAGSGIMSIVLLKSSPVVLRWALVLGIPVLWWAVAYGAFLQGWWIPVAAPVGTGLLSMLLLLLMEQWERQRLMALFSLSLSPEIAQLLWRRQEELWMQGRIRGEEFTSTLLFCDIRGFTAITKSLPAAMLLPWLNQYFEAMADCIMGHGGVVDKYIGDAVMAAFGVPADPATKPRVKPDAWAAVRASAAMAQRLQELNQEFARQGLPTIQFVIGLHTGALVGGTVGSRTRASYSLFGDTVNVAARLQEEAKKLTQDAPYPILMSQATYDCVRDRCQVISKGQIQLRGQARKTAVYALAAVGHEPLPQRHEVLC